MSYSVQFINGRFTNQSQLNLRSYVNKSLNLQYKSSDWMLQKQPWAEMAEIGGLMFQTQEKDKNDSSSLKHSFSNFLIEQHHRKNLG